jgi:hypothetical protein
MAAPVPGQAIGAPLEVEVVVELAAMLDVDVLVPADTVDPDADAVVPPPPLLVAVEEEQAASATMARTVNGREEKVMEPRSCPVYAA